MQNVHKLQGDTIIMGSSLTERFRPSEKTAVLGIPGSSFLAGLELMNEVIDFPAGTTYALEINNMFNGVYRPVLEDAQKWDFRAFRRSPNFSIASKPSNLLLSAMERVLRPAVDYSSKNCDDIPVMKPICENQEEPLSQEEAEKWKDVIVGVERIRQKGGRVCFVRFPVRDSTRYQESYVLACKIAKFLHVPILNYNTDYWRRKLEFTDGAHLNSRALSTSVFRDVIARDAKQCAK